MNKQTLKRIVSVLLLGLLLPATSLPGYALTTINGNVTWTDPAPLTDSLTINGTLRILSSNGIDGGNFILNLPNGGALIINNGGLLNLSAQSGNGNGGNFITNLLGATGAITINGIIRSNGLGTGRGGTINLTGSTYGIGTTAVIEALGGTGGAGGQGGIISLKQSTGLLSISDGANIRTNGLGTATQNLITIEADAIDMAGQINANGIVNGAGGKVMLVANSGQIDIKNNGNISAVGSGTGQGGTVEFKAHQAGTPLRINSDSCFLFWCDVGESASDSISINTNSIVNVAGGNGNNNGIIRIGRAGSGTIVQDINDFPNAMFRGAGTVVFGDDGGNTTATTISNYAQASDFNGTNPVIQLHATGNITATGNNNFGRITATSNTGTINITDTSGGMTVESLSTSGASTLTANGGGALTLSNATTTGSVTLQTDGIVTATTGNNITGAISINGDGGAADRAGAVSLTNANTTNINRIRSTSATLISTGAASDMTVTNLDVTNGTTLTSGRDITANAASNNFGATVAASGRNITLADNAGAFTLNGITATGTLGLAAANAQNMSLTNIDSTGTATISTSGGGDISGSTGNIFRGAADITTNVASGGNITLTADFRGNTTLFGDILNITDSAGDLTITNLSTGSTLTPSYIRSLSNGSNINISTYDIGNGGGGLLQVEANKNINYTKLASPWTLDERLVLNSTNGGNIAINDVVTNQAINGRIAAYDITTAGQGISMSTNGGSYTLNNTNNSSTTTIQAANSIGGTGNIFGGATNFDANLGTAYNVIFTASDFQNATNAFDGANLVVSDNAGGLSISSATATGAANFNTTGIGQNLTINNADITGAVTILASGGDADITGSGNVFRNTATINTNDNVGGDITLSADFQGATSLTGDRIQVTDTAGNFTVTTFSTGSNASASTITANAAGADVFVSGLNLNSTGATNAGRLNITANDQISINGAGWTSTNDIINANSTNGGNVTLSNTTLTGTAPISGITGTQNSASAGIYFGTNGGSYTITNTSVNNNVNITAKNNNITLGTSAAPVSITGTTTFNAGNGDVTSVATFGGSVSGTAGRIGLVSTGNITSAGLTATGNTGWYGAADETLIVQSRNGDILGSGFTTSGAGNIRLQAGGSAYQNANNDINVSNVVAGQNLALYATGANAGTSINVGGTSSVTGHITATNINASNQKSATTGGISIATSSGNINTALVWSNAGTVNLTANNGSILQDTSVYSGSSTGVANGKTVWGSGPINLTAQGGANRYIDTGVMALTATGTGGDITAKASGDANGNGTGVSINLRGRADGNLSATNISNGNTTGHVYLGTSIGASATDLEDSPGTTMDVMGATTVKANGDGRFYGSFKTLDVTARSVNGQVDRGSVNISKITTSATTGTAVNLAVLQGKITGGNVSTAGSAHIYLQAGSVTPRDTLTNINLTNVTAGGNLDVVVAGSTTGTDSGQSVVITGSKGGTSSATQPGGGAPVGSVSMP